MYTTNDPEVKERMTTQLGRHCLARHLNGRDALRVHPCYKEAIDRALELDEIMVMGTEYNSEQRIDLFLVKHNPQGKK